MRLLMRLSKRLNENKSINSSNMEDKLTIKHQLQIGNFVATMLTNEAICLATIGTEDNNGGCVLAIYNPITDMRVYPFIKQQMELALAGDKSCANALHVRCTTLYLVKTFTIIDPQFANDCIDAANAMHERVKKAYDATGVKDVEVQSDDEFFKAQEAVEAAKASSAE